MAFLRSKLIALVLGPTGIGLMGVLTAFQSNLSSVAGWGLGTSAVRTIAGAREAERPPKLAALRSFGRWLAWAGFFCSLLLVWPVGYLTFRSQDYALEMLITGLAVPCIITTSIWTAILQAGGHISSMAKTQIMSSLFGLLLGLPFIWLFGSVGIALSIFMAAGMTTFITWLTARHHVQPGAAMATKADILELVQLGAAVQFGNILGALSTYFVRVLILRSHGDDVAAGLADAGYYQAAFSITSGLPGVIFSATSSDFYPRVAAAKDEADARQITEKQVLASLLLAMPILMALLTMGPLAIRWLYAEGFEPAVPLLEWFVWAIFCFLMGWPLGFWLTARGSKRTVAFFQGLSYLLMFALCLFLIPKYGVRGAAAGYLASGLIYTVVLLGFTRILSGRWLSFRTFSAFVFGAGVLVVGRSGATFFASAYWGICATAFTALACIIIYLRAMAIDQKGEAS
jgi:PST family polysaccharide transporter